jgi:hypothetical protein
MLARRLTTILPAMTLAEVLETTRIHRVAGLTPRPCHVLPQPIPDAGLIGGGHVPLPGEVSLVHNGVLFLEVRDLSQIGIMAVAGENGLREVRMEGGGVARKRVPGMLPDAHRARAAARPQPSAMPPAARIGVGATAATT